MKYNVYAISSLEKNYIYVGITNNIKRRFYQHNNGFEKTTKPYKPFKIILLEEFNLRSGARRREKYFKSGVGKEFLKKIKND